MPEFAAIGILAVTLLTTGAAYVFGYLTGRGRHDPVAADLLKTANELLRQADQRLAADESGLAELQRYRDAFGELPGSVDVRW